MNKIYIFDVDGTLTPSRLRMTEEFAKFFDEWSSEGIFKNSFAYPEIKKELVRENKYYLVTGSDLDKTKEQLPITYIDRAEAIFTCCGNQMWKNNKLVYENKFKVPQNLLTYLGEELRMTDYPVKAGNYIEDRGSLLNFSMVGRNCTQVQREDYYRYDNLIGERERISKHIREQWLNLDAVIGGQISIDIYPKGNDKSQIMKHITDDIIREVHPDIYNVDTEFIFIGDGIDNKGNDYPLAKLMNTKENCSSFNTDGWEHTKEILESLND